jgi:hypothetical protein
MYDAHSAGLAATDSLPIDGLFFSTFLLACSAGFLVASVTAHVLQLLTPPRGHLVPRLRRAALSAHILLTALIVLGLASIWPHPSVTYTDSSYDAVSASVRLHALALALLLVAQLAWTQLAPVVSAFSLFAWGVVSFSTVRTAVLRMLLGQSPLLEASVALAGLGLLAALSVAITRRRDRPTGVDPIVEALLRTFGRDEPRATAAPTQASPLTIPALAPPRLFTARTRLRLHRRAASAGVPGGFTGLLVGGLLVLWVLAFQFFGVGQADPMTPRVICFMASIVPVMIVTATAMENRGPLLIHGLLLPTPRPRFVRELGLAMLANLLATWAAAMLPVLAWAAFLAPAIIRPSAGALASIVSVAAGYQIFAFGAAAWILRLTHRLAITFALAGLCSLGVLILIDAGVGARHPSALLVAAIATALSVVGLAFTLTAYARWAHSEPPSAGPSKTAAAL